MEDIKGKSLNALCVALITIKYLGIPINSIKPFGIAIPSSNSGDLELLIWVAFGFYLIRYFQRLRGLLGNLLNDFLDRYKFEYLNVEKQGSYALNLSSRKDFHIELARNFLQPKIPSINLLTQRASYPSFPYRIVR